MRGQERPNFHPTKEEQSFIQKVKVTEILDSEAGMKYSGRGRPKVKKKVR